RPLRDPRTRAPSRRRDPPPWCPELAACRRGERLAGRDVQPDERRQPVVAGAPDEAEVGLEKEQPRRESHGLDECGASLLASRLVRLGRELPEAVEDLAVPLERERRPRRARGHLGGERATGQRRARLLPRGSADRRAECRRPPP